MLIIVQPPPGFKNNLYSVLDVLVVTLAFRYWAIVERQWLNRSRKKPSTVARAFLWYTPLSQGELLARLCLFVTVWNSLVDVWYQLYELPEAVQWYGRYVEAPGRWTALISNLGLIISVLICYFWSRAEYRLHSHPLPRPHFPHNLRFLYTPRSAEGWLCQLCFYSMLALCIREGWLLGEEMRMFERVLVDLYPPEYSSAVQKVLPLWMLFAETVMRTALPLYGGYRWGLAEFRSRNNTRKTLQQTVLDSSVPA